MKKTINHKKDLFNYMVSRDNEILDVFNEVVQNHDSIIDENDNNKVVSSFYGSGCGYAWVVYDKRSTKVDEFINSGVHKEIIQKFKKHIISKVPSKIKKEIESNGCPIESILYQDLDIQIHIIDIVVDYIINTFKAKNVTYRYRED